MNTSGGNIKIFSGTSNTELAAGIAKEIGLSVSKATVGQFSDGEISVNLSETVRGADVYIVNSTSGPVNDHLMELLIMIDACKRSSAGRINAVIPYYGYARQDRKARPRDPISAKLVADMITTAGCAQIQGFFNIPVDHLKGNSLLTDYYEMKFEDDMEDMVAVSPDLGSVARVRSFAEKLNIPLAIIDKRRPRPNVSEIMNIIGDIKGKKVLLVDDMIDTAGTICNGANAIKERGAKAVYACATHGVLSGKAIERIESSAIEQLVLLDTIQLPPEKLSPKIKVLSTAKIFADAIYRIHEGLPISRLYD